MSRRAFALTLSHSTRPRVRGLPISLGLHGTLAAAVLLVPILTNVPLPEVRANPGILVGPLQLVPPPPPPAKLEGVPTGRTVRAELQPKEDGFRLPPVLPTTLPPPEPEDFGGFGEGSKDGVLGGFGSGPMPSLVGGDLTRSGQAEAPPLVPVRVSVLEQPRKLVNVAPVYPETARLIHLEGTVILDCTVAPNGEVAKVEVLSGHPLLAPAAVEAARQWRYSPTKLGGVAVPVKLTATVHFRLSSGRG